MFIILELAVDLKDAGLEVSVHNKSMRYQGKFILHIRDNNYIFVNIDDEMSWLCSTPIMKDFYDDLEYFELKRNFFKIFHNLYIKILIYKL